MTGTFEVLHDPRRAGGDDEAQGLRDQERELAAFGCTLDQLELRIAVLG